MSQRPCRFTMASITGFRIRFRGIKRIAFQRVIIATAVAGFTSHLQEIRPLPREQKSRRILESRRVARQAALVNCIVPQGGTHLAQMQLRQVFRMRWRMTIQAAP